MVDESDSRGLKIPLTYDEGVSFLQEFSAFHWNTPAGQVGIEGLITQLCKLPIALRRSDPCLLRAER